VCTHIHVCICADYGHKRGDDSKEIKPIFNKEKKVCGSSLSLQPHKSRLSTKDGTKKGGAMLLRVLEASPSWYNNTINPLAPELFFLILARPVYKM